MHFHTRDRLGCASLLSFLLVCAAWVSRAYRSSFHIATFAVETSSARMERHVERRFFVVGAELAHVDRFEIVAGDRLAPLFDGFTNRVRDVIGQTPMPTHGPPTRT